MVYHIMKDGSIKTDITGHVIKMNDVPQAYDLIERIENKYISKKENKKEVAV